jgi:CsoR family transcriptional regulator, copper-sensing transcriptional repressor
MGAARRFSVNGNDIEIAVAQVFVQPLQQIPPGGIMFGSVEAQPVMETMTAETKSTQSGATRKAPTRKAHGIDQTAKAANLARLKRIEGQIRGIHRMVEADQYCADVVRQVSAAQQALRAVGRELIRNHLTHCATHAITAGGAEATAMYGELLEMFDKNYR